MDAYLVLEIKYDANDDEIKKAFRRLSMLHHPDRPGGNEEKYKKITAAYAELQKRSKQQSSKDDFTPRYYEWNSRTYYNPFTQKASEDFWHDIYKNSVFQDEMKQTREDIAKAQADLNKLFNDSMDEMMRDQRSYRYGNWGNDPTKP